MPHFLPMDERQVTRFLAFGRVAIGSALVVLPGPAGAGWIGPSAHEPATKVALRALGVRDAVLGIGALQAISQGTPVRPWVQAGVLSDVVDLAASVLAVRAIGLRRTLTVAVVAGTAAALGARIADAVD